MMTMADQVLVQIHCQVFTQGGRSIQKREQGSWAIISLEVFGWVRNRLAAIG